MGQFKGIISVYTEDHKQKQDDLKNKKIKQIFEILTQINNSKLKENEVELNLQMLGDQKDRDDFRQKMIDLGLGHLKILKRLMDIQSEEFIKNELLRK